MRRIPVDAAALGDVRFVQAEQQRDQQGEPLLWDGVPVQVASLLIKPKGERPEVLQVKVVRAEPVRVDENARVRVVDLTATPWARDGRDGVSYQAADITPLGGPQPQKP